jgi:hypothetical protein
MNNEMNSQNNTQKVVERRKSSTSEVVLIVLMVLVLSISIGYALLSTSLNIRGSSTVQDAKWDIGGGDIECEEGEICTIDPQDPGETPPGVAQCDPSVEDCGNGAVIWMEGDTVYFKHVLTKPGDTFVFYTTIKNKGNINAKVSNVIKNELNPTARRFLDYVVTDASGNEITQGRVLNAGESLKVKVRVSYKTNIPALPTAEEIALINEIAEGNTGATSFFSVTFEQAQ